MASSGRLASLTHPTLSRPRRILAPPDKCAAVHLRGLHRAAQPSGWPRRRKATRLVRSIGRWHAAQERLPADIRRLRDASIIPTERLLFALARVVQGCVRAAERRGGAVQHNHVGLSDGELHPAYVLRAPGAAHRPAIQLAPVYHQRPRPAGEFDNIRAYDAAVDISVTLPRNCSCLRRRCIEPGIKPWGCAGQGHGRRCWRWRQQREQRR